MRKSTVKPNAPNRIAEHRIAQGLSLKELAEKIGKGTSDVNLHRWETGKTNVNMTRMKQIADALGVHPSDLLPLHTPQVPQKGQVIQEPTPALHASDNVQEVALRVETLERLAALRKKGLITPMEFRSERLKLMGSNKQKAASAPAGYANKGKTRVTDR